EENRYGDGELYPRGVRTLRRLAEWAAGGTGDHPAHLLPQGPIHTCRGGIEDEVDAQRGLAALRIRARLVESPPLRQCGARGGHVDDDLHGGHLRHVAGKRERSDHHVRAGVRVTSEVGVLSETGIAKALVPGERQPRSRIRAPGSDREHDACDHVRDTNHLAVWLHERTPSPGRSGQRAECRTSRAVNGGTPEVTSLRRSVTATVTSRFPPRRHGPARGPRAGRSRRVRAWRGRCGARPSWRSLPRSEVEAEPAR